MSPMLLNNILSPQCTLCQARATSKKKAIELLCDLIGREDLTLDPQEIYQAMITRERLGSTAIGQGIALPHGRVESDHCVGAIIHLEEGIDFDAVDDIPVDLLFGLVVPVNSTDEHLEILSRLATMFRDKNFSQALRGAENDQSLYEMIVHYAK